MIDIKFTKAHAYGNDFIYVRKDAVEGVRQGGHSFASRANCATVTRASAEMA